LPSHRSVKRHWVAELIAIPAAILFDVDDTLVDSVHLQALAWQEALAHFGQGVELAEVRAQIRKGGDPLARL
jgi:beta-phosphoglucomutase-like phosphatase (HAD superfamily)